MPIRVRSLEAIYANLKAGRWEKDKNVYFHEAELLIRLDGYISRGWRDKFGIPVEELGISLKKSVLPLNKGTPINSLKINLNEE